MPRLGLSAMAVLGLFLFPPLSFGQSSETYVECIRYVAHARNTEFSYLASAAAACQTVTDLDCVQYASNNQVDFESRRSAAEVCREDYVDAGPNVVVLWVTDRACVLAVTRGSVDLPERRTATKVCKRRIYRVVR